MRSLVPSGLLMCALAVSAGRTTAEESQDDVVAGAFTYRNHCQRCHGAAGEGDGPAAENLPIQPRDLRRIARRNGGEFPTEKVRRIVDGRKPVKGHGDSTMPVFGDVFRKSGNRYDEELAELQIRAVVAYVKSLQIP